MMTVTMTSRMMTMRNSVTRDAVGTVGLQTTTLRVATVGEERACADKVDLIDGFDGRCRL
jgi:hypothetical protein